MPVEFDDRERCLVCVYFIQAPVNGLIKIGHTTIHPVCRLLTFRVGSPVPLLPVGIIPGPRIREGEIHARFHHLRDHGEWFRPGPDLIRYIRRHGRPWPGAERISFCWTPKSPLKPRPPRVPVPSPAPEPQVSAESPHPLPTREELEREHAEIEARIAARCERPRYGPEHFAGVRRLHQIERALAELGAPVKSYNSGTTRARNRRPVNGAC